MALRALGIEPTKEDIKNLIVAAKAGNIKDKEQQKEAAGAIDFKEFLDIMAIKMSECDKDDELSRAYEMFKDSKEGGVITLESLRRIADELGETMTNEELMEMIMESNKSKQYTFL